MNDAVGVPPSDRASATPVAALLTAVASEQDWMTGALVRLMSARSVRGNEESAQRIVESILREMRFETTDVWMEPSEDGGAPRRNVVAQWARDDHRTGRSLTLSGHVDVPPPPVLGLWSFPPFEPRCERGHVIGWGGLKAGLVAMLGAIRALRANGLAPNASVRIQSVIDEEVGGAGAAAIEAALPPLDGALVAGAAGSTVAVAQVGVLWFDLRVRIPPSHAATLTTENSALSKALQLAGALRELSRELDREAPEPFGHSAAPSGFNVGAVRGGTMPSTAVGECVLGCRIGVLPGHTVADVLAAVRERLHTTAESDPVLRAYPPSLEVGPYASEAYELEPEARIVQAALAAHRHAGTEAQCIGATTGTDTHVFINSGTPAVVMGPPVTNLHSVEEWITVRSLLAAAQRMALFIAEWTGVTTDDRGNASVLHSPKRPPPR